MSRITARALAGLLGVLLLACLVERTGPAKLLASIATLGWGLSLVIALGGVSHLVKAWAWRITLSDEKRHVSFGRMLGLRIASEAVGQLGFLGQVFGETLRVSLLSSTIPVASGITSVTLDRALFILGGAVVSTAGMIAALVVLPLPHALALYAGLFALVLFGVILVMAIAVQRRWAVFSGTAEVLGRVRYFSGWLKRERCLIQSVENQLLDFCHHSPRAFWGSFALNLTCHAVATLEVYLILWLMGVKISFLAALAIEAFTKLINILGTFNPGNIGTYEGGNMVIARMFGLGGTVGLTLGLTRRVRAIFWAAVGAVCLVVLSKSRKHYTPPATQTENELTGRAHVAVILANDVHDDSSFGSALPQVGALPVLLRAILGAQKAGATRILVVVNQVTGRRVQRELLDTRRLPGCIEWLQLPLSFAQLAGQPEERLVMIAGDRTYHPSLHRLAAEWNEGDALALTTGTELAGIYTFSRHLALELANRGPSNIGSVEDLHTSLISTHSVECELVQEDKWQRILTPQDRLSAEQKLDSWLTKPTDGIFARLNRRISVPISRRLIQFQITPNMVSLFVLGVSFLSGLFYACGGYWNMLLGALLSQFSSVLDGCDGEVARLKLQESAFGCWLDTICDWFYYVFIFVGITIGLLRNSGSRNYLWWGGLLLFGTVVTLMVTGFQRHRLAAGRPEQLLGIWQTQAASRRSNPFLYLGRHTEFIIRRCFLPYALLAFALFNTTNVALIIAAVGVNLVWPIALYSYFAFAAVQTPPAANSPASA